MDCTTAIYTDFPNNFSQLHFSLRKYSRQWRFSSSFITKWKTFSTYVLSFEFWTEQADWSSTRWGKIWENVVLLSLNEWIYNRNVAFVNKNDLRPISRLTKIGHNLNLKLFVFITRKYYNTTFKHQQFFLTDSKSCMLIVWNVFVEIVFFG